MEKRELDMKITKSQLKQIIKEELSVVLNEGGAMGHYSPEVSEDPDSDETQVMEAVKEVLDLAYGPDGYDLGSKLMELSKSASGATASDPENRNADAWDFFKRSDEKSGAVSPEVERRMKNPF